MRSCARTWRRSRDEETPQGRRHLCARATAAHRSRARGGLPVPPHALRKRAAALPAGVVGLDCSGSASQAWGPIYKTFAEVLRLEVADDGVQFDLDSLRVGLIREEQEYGGRTPGGHSPSLGRAGAPPSGRRLRRRGHSGTNRRRFPSAPRLPGPSSLAETVAAVAAFSGRP